MFRHPIYETGRQSIVHSLSFICHFFRKQASPTPNSVQHHLADLEQQPFLRKYRVVPHAGVENAEQQRCGKVQRPSCGLVRGTGQAVDSET